jgi:hypothetical protein
MSEQVVQSENAGISEEEVVRGSFYWMDRMIQGWYKRDASGQYIVPDAQVSAECEEICRAGCILVINYRGIQWGAHHIFGSGPFRRPQLQASLAALTAQYVVQ